MKNLETLLRRYNEGDLNAEELDELNRMTHRDQVLQAANMRVRAIKRRRYSAVAGVAVVLLVTGVFFFARPSVDNQLAETPIMAQADVPTLSEEESGMPVVSKQEEPTQQMTSIETRMLQHDTSILQPKPKLVSVVPVEQAVSEEVDVEQLEPPIVSEDPIVACNTQCSPDSVINDIWKFLRT
ncbi:MAG: hypothetical protein IKH97_00715 [Bacteroidales bacterium]|nr:hypothetical protein [Bacteroidales bacterium]